MVEAKAETMIKDILQNNENLTSNTQTLELLHTHFPQCFNKEGNFDVDKFKELVRTDVDVTHEGYDLNFLGKNYAKLLASVDTTTVIQPDTEHNAKSENANSQNLYISGDNLDGLKHLLKSYTGAVKCIYIDPPYNTGTDGFVYNDKFNFTNQELTNKLSISDEQAQKILDLTTKGRASHSAWLTFMYPRLLLARDLLKPDGVIFISIDDNEQANLKLLCDNIFGEENFVAAIIWRGGKRNTAKWVSNSHEYMLFYAKNLSICDERNISWKEKKKGLDDIYAEAEKIIKATNGNFDLASKMLKKWYKSLQDNNPSKDHDHYCNFDKHGLFCIDNVSRVGGGMYSVLSPITGNEIGPPSRGWVFGKEREFWEAYHSGIIEFTTNDTLPIFKRYLKDNEYQLVETVFYKDRRGSSNRLKDLLGGKIFDFPKDEYALLDKIGITTNDDDIILDFFSGSATTAHSVMLLNAMNEKSKRKYILIQLPETVKEKSEAEKAGYFTIDKIGMERIRRAATKIKAETGAAIDYGFKHYTLVEPSADTLDKLEEFKADEMFTNNNTLSLFGKETVLETWLVKDGYGFGAKVQEVKLANYTAYHCGKHLYFIEAGIDEKDMVALLDKYQQESAFSPENIVVFGYSFNFSQTEMLRKNLFVLKDSHKNLKANFDIRY